MSKELMDKYGNPRYEVAFGNLRCTLAMKENDAPLFHLTVERKEEVDGISFLETFDVPFPNISPDAPPKSVMAALGIIWGMYDDSYCEGGKEKAKALGAGISRLLLDDILRRASLLR